MNEFAKSCIAHKDAEGFNFVVAITDTFNTIGDGYWSEVAKAVTVNEFGMYVNTDGEEYGCGDFYVLYDENTWEDDVDGLIYTDSLFLKHTQNALAQALIKMGVDNTTAKDIANTVSYSEQGMQDYGRVSFDAYELADFLRNFYTSATA